MLSVSFHNSGGAGDDLLSVLIANHGRKLHYGLVFSLVRDHTFGGYGVPEEDRGAKRDVHSQEQSAGARQLGAQNSGYEPCRQHAVGGADSLGGVQYSIDAVWPMNASALLKEECSESEASALSTGGTFFNALIKDA